MAYVVPLDQPLSETQAKLIAQVGSMKNLADLPFLKKFKLKKGDEISLFDYLLKVLRSMGIDPQILLTAFLYEFFKTDKLVEFLLTGMARLAATMNKKLGNPITTVSGADMSDEQITELIDSNYNWLITTTSPVHIRSALTIVVNALKTRIIQELMVLIFGKPKKAAVGADGLVNDQSRMDELIDEAVCGGEAIFSVSIPASTNNGDLEYNRLQKMEQVKNGNLSFQITCQGVQISLPDDPMYLFKSVPPGFQGGETVAPETAMFNVFSYVSGKVQKGTSGENSQSNAISAEKSFIQKFLETLISSITTLVKPFFVGIIGTIPGEAEGIMVGSDAYNILTDGLINQVFKDSDFQNPVTTNPITGKREGDYVPPTCCQILNEYTKSNLDSVQKKKISLLTILCNLILNIAIGFILAYVLEKVKKMIKNYMAKRAQERAARKLKKIQDKYKSSISGRSAQKADKAARQAKLMKEVVGILQFKKNTKSVPMFN